MIELEYLKEIFNGPIRQRYDDKGRWAQIQEGQLLYDLVRSSKADLFFEIGTANGWTALWASAAGATVYTFDVSNRVKVYQDKKFLFPEMANRIHFKEIGSPLCVENMRTVPRTESVAIFFIDGDHSFKGITQDFNAVIPLLRKGDLVVFHDTDPREVGSHRFWSQLKSTYPLQCTDYPTKNGMGVLTW